MNRWIDVPVESLVPGDVIEWKGKEEKIEYVISVVDDAGINFIRGLLFEGDSADSFVRLELNQTVKRRRTVLDITPEELIVRRHPNLRPASTAASSILIDDARKYIEALKKFASELEEDT